MNKNFYQNLLNWPKAYITDVDLIAIVKGSKASRYGIVNRAIKQGFLNRIRRGLYMITISGKEEKIDAFELAQLIYGPSFISVESALQYHNMIPERTYTITSVSIKRSREFFSLIGLFSYQSIPKLNFLVGVEHIKCNSSGFLMAMPWRAIADLIYLNKKKWDNFKNMCDDMRIDNEVVLKKKISSLDDLIKKYPNTRTIDILKNIRNSLKKLSK